MNDIFRILNDGPGSPGETARIITNTYLILKNNSDVGDNEIFRKMLQDFADIYRNLGITYLDRKMIDRIVLKSNGELPFIIFADILVTNYNQFENNMQALISNFDLIFKIVVYNYTKLVDKKYYIKDTISLNENILHFIQEEMEITSFK